MIFFSGISQVRLSQIADEFNKYNFMISLEPNMFRRTTWRVVRQSIIIALLF